MFSVSPSWPSQVMTSAAQEVGCVQALIVLGADRDCTPSHQTTTESGAQPLLKPASAASYSCSHWPSCCFSDDWPPLPSIRLQSLELIGNIGWTKGVWWGKDKNLTLPKKKRKKRKKTFWRMNRHFVCPSGAKMESDNILYFVLLSFVVVWMWFVDVVICWAAFIGFLQWGWLDVDGDDEDNEDKEKMMKIIIRLSVRIYWH